MQSTRSLGVGWHYFQWMGCCSRCMWTGRCGFILKKGKKADDILLKLWQTQAIQMILWLLQIHLPKPNPCWVTWSKQRKILVYTYTQIKQSLSVLTQEGVMSTFTFTHTHTHTHTHTYIYIYIYICVCMWQESRLKAREKRMKKERKRERERERECVCVCVCVLSCVSDRI